uniref:Elongation factor 4 n=1 Tax=Anthurium amnicola TaxID=1678845 RepID=A0A1D1XCL0_9ARAE
MKYIYFITLLVLASVTLSSAQIDFGSLTDNCKNQLTQMLGNKDLNACFPFGTAATLFTSKGIPSDDALKSTADAICGAPKCSDSLVSKTMDNITSACQSDLNDPKSIASVVYIAVDLYSPTRDSVCFKNSTGGYCFIESQAAAQQILQSAPKGQNVALTFGGAPKNQVCTPCNKAIFNTYFNYQKSNPDAFTKIRNVTTQNIDDARDALSGKCGQNFLDGKTGDSTEDPAKFQSTLSSNQKSGATSLIANSMGYVVLVGVVLAML